MLARLSALCGLLAVVDLQAETGFNAWLRYAAPVEAAAGEYRLALHAAITDLSGSVLAQSARPSTSRLGKRHPEAGRRSAAPRNAKRSTYLTGQPVGSRSGCSISIRTTARPVSGSGSEISSSTSGLPACACPPRNSTAHRRGAERLPASPCGRETGFALKHCPTVAKRPPSTASKYCLKASEPMKDRPMGITLRRLTALPCTAVAGFLRAIAAGSRPLPRTAASTA